MHRFLIGVTLLLLLAGPVRAAGDQDLYDRGRTAVFEERWQDARRTFEDFARRYPASPYADDAQYWLGMAWYELGDPEQAYAVLKTMTSQYPDSPWNDDGRVLMVRCAEAVLKDASQTPAGAPRVTVSTPSARLAEYESFIEQSTQDSNSKVQLLAIDTMLGSKPGKAPELLPRLNNGKASREAADMVLDRFFGGDRVKVTLEDPDGGLTDGNVAVMVRQGEGVDYLTLSEAIALARSAPGASRVPPYDDATVTEIRDKLIRTEQSLTREGDPGSVEMLPTNGGRSMSAIVKVVDGEVHYYRNGSETTRIVVLKRQGGFNADNIKIFFDDGATVSELSLAEARSISASGGPHGLSEPTVRYLKAALAIIEIDLTRSTGVR